MEHPFQGLQICSILQDQSIQGTRQMACRRFHGFIIKLKGATEYVSGENRWLLEAGQILFVPQGSSYQIRINEAFGCGVIVSQVSNVKYLCPFP